VSLLGLYVGDGVGNKVGADVGFDDGGNVGVNLGESDGAVVGFRVIGEPDGEVVGFCVVGEPEGALVVGFCEGALLGLVVVLSKLSTAIDKDIDMLLNSSAAMDKLLDSKSSR